MTIEFIKPSQLNAAVTVTGTAAIPVDDGINVDKATPKQIVDAGRPIANESQARAGTDNTTAMTPLATAQAIDEATSDIVSDAAAAVAPFASRGDAIAATMPGTADTLSLIHAGMLLEYIRDPAGTALTTNGGTVAWSPVAPVYVEHYGVVSSTSIGGAVNGTDYTTLVQSALNATTGDLLFNGWVKITDMVTIPAYVRPHSTRGHDAGGIAVKSDFNMMATDIVKMVVSSTEGGTIGDFGIYCLQPTTPANRAACVQYPWAFNTGGATRVFIDRLRIAGAWDGFRATGNSGGLGASLLEIGALNRPFDTQGAALDFIKIENIRLWSYGLTTVDQLAVYSDMAGLGSTLGRVDGLHIDSFQIYKSVLTNDQGVDALGGNSMDLLHLDGDGARFVNKSGKLLLSKLVSSKTNASTLPTIQVQAGFFECAKIYTGGSEAQIIEVTGGEANFYGGQLFSNEIANIGATVSAGKLGLYDIAFKLGGTGRTVDYIQQSGTGILQMVNCRPQDRSKVAPAVKFNTDVSGNLLMGRTLGKLTAAIPTITGALLGTYEYQERTIRVSESSTADLRLRQYLDGGVGYREIFETARGTRAAPAASQSGDNLSDIIFSGHDGTQFTPAVFLRSTVAATPTTGFVQGAFEVQVGTATGYARPFYADKKGVIVSGTFVSDSTQPYANRAAFLAADIPATLNASSWWSASPATSGIEEIKVVRMIGGPIGPTADGGYWAPSGDVYFEHFGAVGDGVADDTAAVQAAVNYGEMIYGRNAWYRLTDTISGTIKLRGAGYKFYNYNIADYTDVTGTVFITALTAAEKTRLFNLGAYSDMRDFAVFHTGQDQNRTSPWTPVITPWAFGSGNNAASFQTDSVRLSNIRILEFSHGVNLILGGVRAELQSIMGNMFKIGFQFDANYDVLRVTDCHIITFGGDVVTTDDEWQYRRDNAVGFRVGRCDALHMRGCFVISGDTGIEFYPSEDVRVGFLGNSANGARIEGCNFDGCNKAVWTQGTYTDSGVTARFMNCGMYHPVPNGVWSYTAGEKETVLIEGITRSMTFVNCAIISAADTRPGSIVSCTAFSSNLTFDACMFTDWDKLTAGAPAFYNLKSNSQIDVIAPQLLDSSRDRITTLGSRVLYTGKVRFSGLSFDFTPSFTSATPGDMALSAVTASGQITFNGGVITVQAMWTGTPTFTTSTGYTYITGLPSGLFAHSQTAPVVVHGANLGAGYTDCHALASAALDNKLSLKKHGSTKTEIELGISSFTSGTSYTVQISGQFRA